MKVAVLVKASRSSEAGVMPSQQLLADMGQYNEQLVKAGIMKDGAGLHPSSKAVRVRFSGNDRTVINGPFAETKELVAGYWLWEVKSMDEAIVWLKKCPNPMPEESEVEIRPMFEVIGHCLVEFRHVLARHMGVAVTRQVDQAPGLVHREDIDQLGVPRRGRNARQLRFARQHVQERGLAHVGPADEGKFRQGLVRTRIEIRSAAVKCGG